MIRVGKPRKGTKKEPRRRGTSPHPGVVLIPPSEASRHLWWRARYRDPDSGKVIKEKIEGTNEDARRDWAQRKSNALRLRRDALSKGVPRYTGTALDKIVESYFKAHEHLGERTVAGYRSAADKLVHWADKHTVTTADDLTRARLLEFRDSLIRERRQVPTKEGKRGEWKTGTKARSPQTVNRELRAVRTVLGYLRSREMLLRLTHDDLRDGLKRMPVTHDRVDYLKPAEIRQLLEAAQRHDADTFEETRDEHLGLRPKGTTLRHEPIAPFVAFVLLTGMRVGEAASIEWRSVDLKAIDHSGNEVGEIYLKGASTKTKRGRTVDLSVSPALRAMLASMKLASGGKGAVFGLTRAALDAAQKRLRGDLKLTKAAAKAGKEPGYGAPKSFNWQALRRTCAVYLTNAPGIFGAASAYRSAKQLGHSVTVAERHYVDVARGIPRDAKTLEAAMQCAELIAEIGKARGPAQHSRGSLGERRGR